LHRDARNFFSKLIFCLFFRRSLTGYFDSGNSLSRTGYQRGDIKPSIEVVTKIAEALEVSIDYLVGKTKIIMDKETTERLEDISKLPEDKKITFLV
jgi:hypothetical protein